MGFYFGPSSLLLAKMSGYCGISAQIFSQRFNSRMELSGHFFYISYIRCGIMNRNLPGPSRYLRVGRDRTVNQSRIKRPDTTRLQFYNFTLQFLGRCTSFDTRSSSRSLARSFVYSAILKSDAIFCLVRYSSGQRGSMGEINYLYFSKSYREK